MIRQLTVKMCSTVLRRTSPVKKEKEVLAIVREYADRASKNPMWISMISSIGAVAASLSISPERRLDRFFFSSFESGGVKRRSTLLTLS
jgi:hypothetical protein